MAQNLFLKFTTVLIILLSVNKLSKMAVLTTFIKNTNAFHATFKFLLILILIISGTFYSSCSKNETQTPPSIAALISTIQSYDPDCVCKHYIDQYSWENKTVYVLNCNGPSCDCIAILYDSSAQKIILDSNSSQQFFQQSTFMKNVWTCK